MARVERKPTPKRTKKKGLGDALEAISKPIAKAIDKVTGSNVEECDDCKKRKKALNSITVKDKTKNIADVETWLGVQLLTEPKPEELAWIEETENKHGSLSADDLYYGYDLFNRYLGRFAKPTNCRECVRDVFSTLYGIARIYGK